jgi:hypothetical protein
MPRAIPSIGVLFAAPCIAVLTGVACGGDYAEEAGPSNDAGADTSSTPDGGGQGGDANGTNDAAEIRTPVTPLSFVLRKIFLGDTKRDGTSSSEAWQDYGRDIDGITSTMSANGECKPHGNGTATRVDGPGGVDNSFGKNFIAVIKAFEATPTADANKTIGDGVRVPMVGLDGNGGFFVHSEKTTTPPTYAFSESRLVAAEWTEVGFGAKSKIVNGGVGSDGFYDSNVLVGPTQIVALIGGTTSRPLTIRAARFRMKIAADGLTASEGTLSGVIPTDELVAEVRRFTGTQDPSLCNSATLASIEEQVRNASDMMQDGTQDPTRECDGISIGLGFEMTRVVIGAVAAPVAPPANPCP